MSWRWGARWSGTSRAGEEKGRGEEKTSKALAFIEVLCVGEQKGGGEKKRSGAYACLEVRCVGGGANAGEGRAGQVRRRARGQKAGVGKRRKQEADRGR